MAIPARPARGRKTIKRGAGKRIVEGKSFRLADEVRYIQRRAADYDSRIVTIGQLILFSTKTGDAWLLDPGDQLAARLAPNGEANRSTSRKPIPRSFVSGRGGQVKTKINRRQFQAALGWGAASIALNE